MVTKLPFWVLLGGVGLSFIAGYINAIGFLHNHAVTHMTGLVSQVAIGIEQGEFGRALQLGAVIFAFFSGSVLSGLVIQQSSLQLGRRYGATLIIESFLLFCAVPFLNRNMDIGYYLAAMACGLQNAMATTYSGAIIRTTHLTGFINDFGIAIGHLLRGWPIDTLRFKLYGAVLFGFLTGGIFGVWLSTYFGFEAIYFPATLLGILGVAYFSFVHYVRFIRPKRQAVAEVYENATEL